MGNQLLIGAKYGHLTVLEEAPRGKHHERRYLCQCDCGNIGSFDVANITRNPEHRCRKCVPHSGGYKRPDIVGKVVNEFLRMGYFCKDPDSTAALPVFNRTVPLKDSWAKEAKK